MRNLSVACASGLLLFNFATRAQATLIPGTITDWPESGPLLEIGDGVNHVDFWWSINTFDRGFFYGSAATSEPSDSEVAVATGVTDISQITDASIFSFTSSSVGPLCDPDCNPGGIGAFVVWRNMVSGHYGVLRIDDIFVEDPDTPIADLDGTWWFQTDGTGSFNPIPEPTSGLLFVVGLATLYRRRSRGFRLKR